MEGPIVVRLAGHAVGTFRHVAVGVGEEYARPDEPQASGGSRAGVAREPITLFGRRASPAAAARFNPPVNMKFAR